MHWLTRIVIAITVVGAFGLPSWSGEPDAVELAALIDKHIDARLKAEGVVPAAAADDAEFLRRVYLDLHGVVPTTEQAARFLADTSPNRRLRIVDALLADSRYGAYLGDIWQG
jgi:hypothetical protein